MYAGCVFLNSSSVQQKRGVGEENSGRVSRVHPRLVRKDTAQREKKDLFQNQRAQGGTMMTRPPPSLSGQWCVVVEMMQCVTSMSKQSTTTTATVIPRRSRFRRRRRHPRVVVLMDSSVRMQPPGRIRCIPFAWFFLSLLLLFLLLRIAPCHGFAAYLLSQSNCWTELSTDEVIMNYAVVAAADSDDPDMRIAVVMEDDGSATIRTNDSTGRASWSRCPAFPRPFL